MKAAPAGTIGPRGGGRQLDLAFAIFTANIGRLLLAAAFVVLPVTVAIIVLDFIAFADPGPGREIGLVEIGDTIKTVDLDRFNTIQIVETAVFLLAYALVVGVSYRAADSAYLARPVDPSGSVRFAFGRFHSLLWVSFLVGAGTLVGLLLFVVPGVILYCGWCVVVPALMAEGLRGSKALGRSWDLTEDHRMRAFGVLLVGGGAAAVVGFAAGLITAAADFLAEDYLNLWIVINDLVLGVMQGIGAAFLAVVTVVIYYDLRIRKEGFDIEQMLDALDAEDPVAAPAVEAPASPPVVPEPPRPEPPPAQQPPPSAPPPRPFGE